jgi:3'(2'), 5'-bisphosphate nucleotidase
MAVDSPRGREKWAAFVLSSGGVWSLSRRLPSVSISEENKLLPYEERQSYTYFWCVDPLDGTKVRLAAKGATRVGLRGGMGAVRGFAERV